MSEKKIDLELDEATAAGVYANLAIISHSTSEFVVDFAAVMPGMQRTRVRSRVVLTPEHAKRLYLSLGDNLTRYESTFGRIDLHGVHTTSPDEAVMQFPLVTGEA